MNGIFRIASNLSTPIAFAGLFAAITFFILRQMIGAGQFSTLSRVASSKAIIRIINYLFILSLAAMILGFAGYIASLHFASKVAGEATGPRGQADPTTDAERQEYQKLLFESSQELRSNREYLWAIRAFIDDKARLLPVGVIKYEKTLELLGKHYDGFTRHAYGEEKHIYQIALKLKDVGQMFLKLRERSDYVEWNNTYEMTIDDLSFLCGFLAWYTACTAEGELSLNQSKAVGWNATGNTFATEDQIDSLKMRYFTIEGRPITDFVDFLGLID